MIIRIEGDRHKTKPHTALIIPLPFKSPPKIRLARPPRRILGRATRAHGPNALFLPPSMVCAVESAAGAIRTIRIQKKDQSTAVCTVITIPLSVDEEGGFPEF